MNELDSKVNEWIKKTGFPFEMQVAHAFIKAGFWVSQSVYFKDSELGKYREADIIAHAYRKINEIWFNLTFVIECKSSQDKPWVVMTNEFIKNTVSNDLPIYMTKNFTNSHLEIQQYSDYKSELLFKNNRVFGYTLLTALSNGNDRAYEAMQSVTKACEHFVNSTNASPRKVCNLYFPIIIIEGILYNAKLLESENIELKRIGHCELLLTRSFHEHGNSVIRVFNNSDLYLTAKKLKTVCDEFIENYKPIIKHHLE